MLPLELRTEQTRGERCSICLRKQVIMGDVLMHVAMDSLLQSIQLIPRKTGLSSGTIGVLLGISILCLGGFLFSYTLSIDDEFTIIDQNQSILWHFRLGRFMLGLLRRAFWQSTHPSSPMPHWQEPM